MKKTRSKKISERFLSLFSADFHQYETTSEDYKPPRRILVTKWYDRFYTFLSIVLTLTLIGFLLYTVAESPSFGDPNNPAMNEVAMRYIAQGPQETGATNTIAGMILDYRAFDTFGEALMMFTAAMSVLALLKKTFSQGGKEHEIHR